MDLRERVTRLLRAPGRTDEERVHDAIEEVACTVDDLERRLAIIDPEYQVMARSREPLPIPDGVCDP